MGLKSPLPARGLKKPLPHGKEQRHLDVTILRASVHVTDDDVSFCDSPGMLIRKTAKPYINSTWIAMVIHGFCAGYSMAFNSVQHRRLCNNKS